MADFTAKLASINFAKLQAIAQRIVSVETVEDAYAFAQKVREASEIAINAALRIAGIEQAARGLDDEHNQNVSRAIDMYFEAEAE